MLRAHTIYYLFFFLILSISLNSSCSYCGKKEAAPGESPSPPVTIVNTLPFSTKEPATYQAEIVISFPAGAPTGDPIEDPAEDAAGQKYFVARDGQSRRTDYQLSDKETLILLEKPGGKTTVLLPQKKCSAENAGQPGNSIQSQSDLLRESLTTGWLAEEIPANFVELGKEEINGKQLTKFRARFEKRGSVESRSEALIWVDTELGMPVRTEFYTLKNDVPVNKMTTEFRNLKLGVDPGIFDPPAGCQNITAGEMQKILRQGRLNAE